MPLQGDLSSILFLLSNQMNAESAFKEELCPRSRTQD
jgi:hypothetical protein